MTATVNPEGTTADYRERVAHFIDRAQIEGKLARVAGGLSDESLAALLVSAEQLRDSGIERAASFSKSVRQASGENDG